MTEQDGEHVALAVGLEAGHVAVWLARQKHGSIHPESSRRAPRTCARSRNRAAPPKTTRPVPRACRYAMASMIRFSVALGRIALEAFASSGW